ncbi:AAA family ATPase [Anaerostipes caccae]|uniref:AAA family ATPase n=1 Tax=Anaerostipes caccae TaxID=105841 RepID=UPI00335E961E
MKLLKVKITGLPNFKGELFIDFLAQQRVNDDNKENLHNVFSNIYINNAISFIGINASGKTTILKALVFTINLLNNEPINTMKSKDILDDMLVSEKVIFETCFYYDESVYKLETVVKKEINDIDASERYIIEKEKLFSKGINKVKTKKSLYDFGGEVPKIERNLEEEFLMDDVSIMISLNKKQKKNFLMRDMTRFTDTNRLNILGEFPEELLSFLDPSIEKLKCEVDGKDINICLKFKGKDEILMNHPTQLNRYLSSGTIKGMRVFMNALFMFKGGGYLIVDELENHFNREIVATLIRFFLNKKVNKTGATIIFSTHYPELLDEFERNDCIYIVRNRDGISVENLSNILKRNDIKKSEAYQSDFLEGTVPTYEAYMALKKALIQKW